MARPSAADLTDQIDNLIRECEGYKPGRPGSLFPTAEARSRAGLTSDSQALVVRLRAAIERLAPPSTTYAKELAAVVNDRNWLTSTRIDIYIGILKAIQADAKAGYLDGIAELLHAETFTDILDQASELVEKGYKDAAAVVAGSALETQIRLACQKYGVDITQSSGNPKKADTMNADLVKAGAYNVLQQKAVTGWLAIRNAAAHGEYEKYGRDQVGAMISSVRDFILNYPA